MRYNSIILALIFFTFFTPSQAFVYNNETVCEEFDRYYRFCLAPETYYLKRKREGGIRQTGFLGGIRGSLERIKPWGFYLGIEGVYADGLLKGNLDLEDQIRSALTDAIIEGRLGYSVQFCNFPLQPMFIPYFGVGYATETNKYRPPSPITIKLQTYYKYIAAGLLSYFTLTPQFTLGFFFKGRSPWQAKNKISDDPDFPSEVSTLRITDKLHYRIEMPLYYHNFCCLEGLELGLALFFEKRHYGGREGFPFDFLDTRINIYGGNFQIAYWF